MRGRFSLIAAAVFATAFAACGSTTSGSTTTQTVQADPSACFAAGRHAVDGAVLRMPPGAKAGTTPLLVVVIPGGDGDPGDHLQLRKLADAQRVALLYPTAKDGGFWQLNDKQGTGDVDAVAKTIDDTVATGCFDARRVSITGVSNGAGFTARMGCARPDLFAAVVPVAAGYKALDPCPAAANDNFLDIHGTADTVVPYNGVPPGRKGSVPRFTALWARRAGCSTTPRASQPQRLVTHLVYRGCAGGRHVEAYRLTGTQHGWPGSTGPFTRRNPSGFKAAPAVLRFIRQARRSG
jgi:polyhydroxybutyrate depolymerase